MGYRRGIPRTGAAEGGEAEVRGGGGRKASGSEKEGDPNGGGSYLRGDEVTRPRYRKRRPWLRVLFAGFVVVEALVLYAVDEYSPVYNFEILPVTVTGEDGTSTVVADNPDLSFPLTLGGAKCRVADMAACVAADASAEALATVCCTELLDPDSRGPEELVSSIAAFGYVVVIPGLILLTRGFLLGRLWTLRPTKDPPFFTRGARSKTAWGKRRWHLRVGFFAVDAFIGLFAAVVTGSLFATVVKVTIGRPRPNYYALLFYTENTRNGQDFGHWLVTSCPSGHAATAMSGLVFLAYVLWRDLTALLMWRRRAHPKMSLVLAVLGGFVVAGLPMAAILIGVTRIREYWHRPDDVLLGWAFGFAAAHWCFYFAVLMPFRHEIGSPEWNMNPKWLEDEEQQWEEEDEELRLCGWGRRPRKKRLPWSIAPSSGDATKPPALQPEPPGRVPEAETPTAKLEFYPV